MQIVIIGVISNPHGPDSALINWDMSIESPNKGLEEGNAPYPTAEGLSLPIDAGRSIICKPDERIPLRTLNPIPKGGAVSGWLTKFYERTTYEDFRSGGVIRVWCDDVVANKRHEFKIPYVDATGPKLTDII